MVHRLLLNDHNIVAYNLTQPEIDAAVEKGAEGASSHEDLIAKLPERKVVWLMVPAGKPVDQNIADLENFMNPGDIIIDGGNSFWRESIERGKRLEEKGIHYIDCGVSGGVWGLENGYCLMYGGAAEPAEYILPLIKALAPEKGHLYCGASGSGHMVKMVHNGIEYGMMQAYAEGFEVLEKSPYNLDLEAVSEMWMHGSVIRSWLLELAGLALGDDPRLDKIKGYVPDSGEGRWTIQTAIDFDVPVHVIAASLFTRFESRQDESFAMKMLAALRNQFGGPCRQKKLIKWGLII